MFDTFFDYLATVDDFLWSYVGFTLVTLFGLYFSLKTRFFQFRVLGQLKKTITDLHHDAKGGEAGMHPLRLYFASVGGMVGIGNLVGAVSAILIGGPGALFWLWIANFCGMLVKYSEIYLGMKYRVRNNRGGYDGGPMYYLKAAFGIPAIPIIVCVLLCIYGVEVVQFLVVADAISQSFSLSKHLVVGGLLAAVMYSAFGGIRRLSTICCLLMPGFIIIYVIMSLWVLGTHITEIPELLSLVFHGAFNGHAPLGGFVGSTFLIAARYGISRAVYSGDIGIGYDSIIQSESRAKKPEYQARLAIFSVFTDGIVCTMSMLLVLVTGLWKLNGIPDATHCVSLALGTVFPAMPYFMGIFMFIAGYTTIIAYFAIGLKSARFLSPKWGETIYYIYALFAFPFFAYFDQTKVFLIMSVSGGLLMIFNLAGIVKLRKEIKFK